MASRENPPQMFDEPSKSPVLNKRSDRKENDLENDTSLKRIDGGVFDSADHLFKGLNANTYASKKSFAQGMLDLALLSSNAAQLKYVLTAGDTHQFYILLLTLIIVSLCLQILQAVLCLILGLILDLNKIDEQRSANICNNIGVCLVVIIVVINIIITAFNFKTM